MGKEEETIGPRLFYKGTQHADILEEERQKAIESYLARTASDEVHADPYINLGFLYLEQESYEEALKCFSRVRELEPGNTDNYNNMGYTYERMACLASARYMYQKALELEPRKCGSNNQYCKHTGS